ncbi:ATP-binding protein, partial [Patescibacteria group bacterium]|nr:ATP-binding protein [Patescibacteria group bacterium]
MKLTENSTFIGGIMPNYESILGDIKFFSDILKKSGYKTVSFGTAEIIDNSIDASANDIVVVGESDPSNRIKRIGFLDNGSGMDIEILKKCLQVGTHFETRVRGKGRGKYGFGLPGSSAAHSNIVKVYSWRQREPGKIYMVSLNVNDLAAGIPHPKLVDALPEPYEKLRTKEAAIKKVGATVLGPIDFYSHGTLVLWDGCERITPKTTQTLFQNHLAPSLSRLFRHFITKDPYSAKRFLGCNIYLVYDLAPGKECTAMTLKPNDPLYVMSDHMYAGDFSFELQQKLCKKFMLNKTPVEIRFSLSSREVRQRYKGNNRINTELGKNLGISIIREGREIDFGDFHFFDVSEDRNRFWGCEIMFTKEADDFFGVPANKQHVDQLKKTSQIEGIDEYPEDAPPEELPIWLALERNFKMKSIFSEFLSTIRSYPKPVPPGGTDGEGGDNGEGVDIIDDPGEVEGESTSGGSTTLDDTPARKNAIQELRNIGIETPTDNQIKRFLKHKVVLVFAPLGENTGFMDVQIKYGICVLRINTESSFYRNVLLEVT